MKDSFTEGMRLTNWIAGKTFNKVDFKLNWFSNKHYCIVFDDGSKLEFHSSLQLNYFAMAIFYKNDQQLFSTAIPMILQRGQRSTKIITEGYGYNQQDPFKQDDFTFFKGLKMDSCSFSSESYQGSINKMTLRGLKDFSSYGGISNNDESIVYSGELMISLVISIPYYRLPLNMTSLAKDSDELIYKLID